MTTYTYHDANGNTVLVSGPRPVKCGDCVNYPGPNGCGTIFPETRTTQSATGKCRYAVARAAA